MGVRLSIYEKSPYENFGEEILDCGAFEWGIMSELDGCEIVNKYKDECKSKEKYKDCSWCDCSDDDYIKVTYDKLLTINKEILSKNINIINGFCLKLNNCKLDRECDLDCLENNHRDCIWVNFS